MEAPPEDGLGCAGSSCWVREHKRLGGGLKSDSLGTSIWTQGSVLPHNPVTVGLVFFPIFVPGLAPFPFPNPAFQQFSRLQKNLNSNLFPLQFKQGL